MVGRSRFRLPMATFAAVCLFGAHVRAQEIDASARAVARDLGYAGVAAFERGEYPLAADKLERAFKILQAPSLGLWSARALVRLGKLVQAVERYRMVGRIDTSAGELAVQRQAQQDAIAELAVLEKRMPTLVVLVEGASPDGVVIQIDDVPFPTAMIGETVPANPGSHRLTAKDLGQTVVQTVFLAEAERKQVVMRFAPPGAATASPTDNAPRASRSIEPAAGGAPLERVVGWSALGVGAAAIVTGTVTGAMAMNDRSSLGDLGCNLTHNQCPPELVGDVASYNRLLTISSIGFIGGGVVAAVGAVVLLTVPKTERKVAIRIQPSNVMLVTEF